MLGVEVIGPLGGMGCLGLFPLNGVVLLGLKFALALHGCKVIKYSWH